MSQNSTNFTELNTLEESLVDTVSIDEPWALLEEFSELNRLSGTEDEQQAANYLSDRLTDFGVGYERYDPELYISQPHSASIDVKGEDFTPSPVKTVAVSASTTTEASVEYVGEAKTGIVLGGDGGDPYPDVSAADIEGKIALTAAGSLSIRASRVLEDRGAVGVIAIHQHQDEPHDGIATSIWGGAPRLDEKDRIPDIPVVNVRKPDGERLTELAKEGDLDVEIETELTTDWFECPIIETRIEGGAAPDQDEFVLLHGHYDSWAYGITDNATGDAGMLELARVFSEHSDELERNLRIAWWPAHSTGRYAGSTWYADEFAHDLVENCVGQVNMDSPGAKDSTEYVDMSCWMPEAHPLVAGAIEDVTGADYAEKRPPRAGDYSFDNLGLTGFFMLSSNIPANVREERGYHEVGGCGGNSDAWHLSTDTLDTAGKDELLRDIRMYGVSVFRVLNADVLPYDHVRNVERHIEIVREYQEIAGDEFDFSPTLEELDRLKESVESFYAATEEGEISVHEANRAILSLSRVLTQLNFSKEGQFQQDPATGRPPYPRFGPARKFDTLADPDDRKFLVVQLKREQNHVVNELRQVERKLPDT